MWGVPTRTGRGAVQRSTLRVSEHEVVEDVVDDLAEGLVGPLGLQDDELVGPVGERRGSMQRESNGQERGTRLPSFS